MMGNRSKTIKAYKRRCNRAGVPVFRRPVRSRRPRRSILDLIVMPPFVIMEEICDRVRRKLGVK